MIITLLTDFGTRDVFVGVMKGVILGIAPQAALVDLTHDIPAQDIGAAAFALGAAYSWFPPGTVHLAVADPGVGTSRRAVAAQIGEHIYVCPDNGLLTDVLARETVHDLVVLDKPEFHLPHVSRTFHGRDIFAPVAAHLARGVPLRELGSPTGALLSLPLSRPSVLCDEIVSHVIHRDVFGNVLLDVTEDVLPASDTWAVTLPQVQITGFRDAYGDVPEGDMLLLFGSSGHLEIAVRNGNAARRLGLRVGEEVRLRRVLSPAEAP